MIDNKKLLAVAIVAMFALVAVIPAASIQGDSRTEMQKQIDNYIKSIEYDPNTKIYDPGESVTYTAVMTEEGSKVIVEKSERCTIDNDGATIIENIAATTQEVYPGSLLRANENLAKGNPDYIYTGNRSSIKLTTGLTLPDQSTLFVKNPNDYQQVKSAMDNTIKAWASTGVAPQATRTSSLTTAYSQSQVAVDLGVSLDVLNGIDIGVEYKQKTTEQTVVMKVTQIYYTFGFTLANGGLLYPSQLFGKDTTVDDVKAMLRDEPAVFVSEVTYGKVIYVSATTTSSYENFDVDLGLAINQNSGDISAEGKEVLKNATYKMTIVGGAANSTTVGTTSTYDQVMAEIKEAPTVDDYYNGAMISASTKWLDSFDDAHSFVSTEYLKTTRTELQEITFHYLQDCAYKGNVRINYKTFTGVDPNTGDFTGVADAELNIKDATTKQDLTMTIPAKHLGPFKITAWATLGANAYDNYEFNDPTEIIEFNFNGGSSCDLEWEFWVDGKRIH